MSGHPPTGSAFGEMHLLPEPLFTVPTDNTHVLNITGTENGRIFMTGKDGCLYELAYQVPTADFLVSSYKQSFVNIHLATV